MNSQFVIMSGMLQVAKDAAEALIRDPSLHEQEVANSTGLRVMRKSAVTHEPVYYEFTHADEPFVIFEMKEGRG